MLSAFARSIRPNQVLLRPSSRRPDRLPLGLDVGLGIQQEPDARLDVGPGIQQEPDARQSRQPCKSPKKAWEVLPWMLNFSMPTITSLSTTTLSISNVRYRLGFAELLSHGVWIRSAGSLAPTNLPYRSRAPLVGAREHAAPEGVDGPLAVISLGCLVLIQQAAPSPVDWPNSNSRWSCVCPLRMRSMCLTWSWPPNTKSTNLSKEFAVTL